MVLKPLRFGGDFFLQQLTGTGYKKMVEGIPESGWSTYSVIGAFGVRLGFSLPCWYAHLPDPGSGSGCPLLENCPGVWRESPFLSQRYPFLWEDHSQQLTDIVVLKGWSLVSRWNQLGGTTVLQGFPWDHTECGLLILVWVFSLPYLSSPCEYCINTSLV